MCKQQSLKQFCHETLIEFLPFQDKAIVLELLISELNKCCEVRDIKCIYNKIGIFENISDSLSTDRYDALIDWFRTSFFVSTERDIFTDSNQDHFLYLPLFILGQTFAIIRVELVSKEKLIIDHKRQLDEISYFVSVMLDRIDYLEQLSKSNKELNVLNKGLKKANKQLNKDLHKAIEHYQNQLNLAEGLTQTYCQNLISKEIAHEVKNPLSIILFDLELIKESICQIDIDWDLITIIETFYNLKSGEIKRDFNKENGIEDIDLLKYQSYPSLYNYLIMMRNTNKVNHYMSDVRKNISNVSSMLDVIMKYGVTNSYNPQIIDFREVLDDVLSLFQIKIQLKDIKLSINGEKGKTFIMIEKTRIYQVLINIIKNSIESIELSPKRELNFTLKKKNKHCELCVIDSGEGFQPYSINNILFKSTKNGHFGLGILISQEILKKYQGTLTYKKMKNEMHTYLEFPTSTDVLVK